MPQYLLYPGNLSPHLHDFAGRRVDEERFRALMLEYLLRDRPEGSAAPEISNRLRNALVHYGGGPTETQWGSADSVDPLRDIYVFHLLENRRSDVASLARFSQRVDFATFHLCTALSSTKTKPFWRRPSVRINKAAKSWYAYLVAETFERYRVLRNALIMEWSPPPEAEPLRFVAFLSLCELTPAESQLRLLFHQDRPRAFTELTRHLDLVVEQLEVTVKLAEDLAPDASYPVVDNEDARRAAIQADILAKAGESLSLTEAAKRLNTSRQNLHKRISTGSAIGVMRNNEFVVPSAQFIEAGKGWQIVPHLRDVLSLFQNAEAGNWSALQFLVEHDPSLGAIPLDVIRSGNPKAAAAAARAFLGLDEA